MCVCQQEGGWHRARRKIDLDRVRKMDEREREKGEGGTVEQQEEERER